MVDLKHHAGKGGILRRIWHQTRGEKKAQDAHAEQKKCKKQKHGEEDDLEGSGDESDEPVEEDNGDCECPHCPDSSRRNR